MNGCAVVDFEAFRGVAGEFVIKELAIVDLDHGLCRYVLFKSPYRRQRLNKKYRRVATWLEQHLHGISWSDGEVDYTLLPDVIRDVCDTYSIVFTKGLEKARFLRTFHNTVIDLNELCAPNYDYSTHGKLIQCSVSSHRLQDGHNKCVYKCALNKAYFYVNWLRSRVTTRRITFDCGVPLTIRISTFT